MAGMSDLPAEFHALPRKEARAYLQAFVEEMPRSRERLAQMLDFAGADTSLATDLDPSRLDEIWDAVRQHLPLRWQEGYLPPPDTATPAPRPPTLEALGDLAELPSWFLHDRSHFTVFSPGTLWVIDVLGRHLGEVLRSRWTTLDWMLGPARPASNIDKNKPVVGTGSTWVNPLAGVSSLVSTEIGGNRHPSAAASLQEMYARIAARIPHW